MIAYFLMKLPTRTSVLFLILFRHLLQPCLSHNKVTKLVDSPNSFNLIGLFVL